MVMFVRALESAPLFVGSSKFIPLQSSSVIMLHSNVNSESDFTLTTRLRPCVTDTLDWALNVKHSVTHPSTRSSANFGTRSTQRFNTEGKPKTRAADLRTKSKTQKHLLRKRFADRAERKKRTCMLVEKPREIKARCFGNLVTSSACCR